MPSMSSNGWVLSPSLHSRSDISTPPVVMKKTERWVYLNDLKEKIDAQNSQG